MSTPEVDDEVLVCFEHGDFRRPYVLGGLFNGVDKPKDADIVDEASGKVGVRAFTTRTGHSLKFTDTDDKKGIKLATGGSQQESIELDAAGKKITISSSGDITIDTKGTGKVTITASRRDEARGQDESRAEGADREDQRRRAGRGEVGRPTRARGHDPQREGHRRWPRSSRAGFCPSRAALVKIN